MKPPPSPVMPKIRKAKTVDVNAIVDELGPDVRFRRSRTMLGGIQWTCILPNGRSAAVVASGRTPIEALSAVKAVADELDADLSDDLARSIDAVRASKVGAR